MLKKGFIFVPWKSFSRESSSKHLLQQSGSQYGPLKEKKIKTIWIINPLPGTFSDQIIISTRILRTSTWNSKSSQHFRSITFYTSYKHYTQQLNDGLSNLIGLKITKKKLITDGCGTKTLHILRELHHVNEKWSSLFDISKLLKTMKNIFIIIGFCFWTPSIIFFREHSEYSANGSLSLMRLKVP